jgi:hypothetical protein
VVLSALAAGNFPAADVLGSQIAVALSSLGIVGDVHRFPNIKLVHHDIT